jgi:SAM-dependent methyltransferase
MRLAQKIKRLFTHVYVLGCYWPDYRDAWLEPTRTDGRPDRVLDAGCGRGEVLAEFERFRVPVDYHGVDLAVGDPAWEFKVSAVADVHRLPFRAASFDKVICNQVLEHVDEPDTVLHEFARVLRPGGRLFLSVPFIWHLHQEPYDRFRFSRNALEYLVNKHGLRADLIRPMGGYFTVLRYLLTSHTLVSADWGRPWRSLARLGDRLLRLVDSTVGAPAFYLLDHLDRGRKLTLGYFLHLSRPGPGSGGLPADPYCCPRCAADEPEPFLRRAGQWVCPRCSTAFPLQAGVPLLTLPNSYRPVTDRILTNGAAL